MNCNCGLTYVCSYRWWTVHSATIQLRSFHLHPPPLQYSICFCFPTDKLSSHQLQTTSQLSLPLCSCCSHLLLLFPFRSHSLEPLILSRLSFSPPSPTWFSFHLLVLSVIISLFPFPSLCHVNPKRRKQGTRRKISSRGWWVPFSSKVLYCIWFYIRIMSLCSSFFNLFLSQKVTNHLVKMFFHFQPREQEERERERE